MIVEQIMKTDLFTLFASNTVREAVILMNEKKIHHIPIVNEDSNLIGLVTEQDIKNALPSSLQNESEQAIDEEPLSSIMTINPIVGHPLDFMEEVALTLYDEKISCVPIVSQNKLVGIVTTTDLLYAYIELTGSHKPSSKIDIRVDDRPGMLNDITETFRAYKTNILSILIYPDYNDKTKRILSIRLQVINPVEIIAKLRQGGFDVLWPNLPGVVL